MLVSIELVLLASVLLQVHTLLKLKKPEPVPVRCKRS